MIAPLANLLGGMAEAFAPRERIGLADWCARELRLPPESGPNPGGVDFEAFPFAREIVDAADDPEVEEIVMVGATQWGKTTIVQCILAALAVLRPAPAMLCAPDEIAVKKLRNKFYGMCDATEALRDRVPPHRLRNMSEIDFGTSICHLAWTGNPQRVSGESCRVVLVSETDRAHRAMHEGALHKLIAERVKAWHNFLIVFEGTPTDDTSTIVKKYEDSNRQRFLVPCPHCGHWQPLRFFVHKEGPHAGCGGVGGMKDDRGEWISADEARDRAYYVCELGCRIDQHQKDPMIRRGRWCPAGCTIEQDGSMVGTPLRTRRICGFGELCSLYSPTISIGRMAAEYLSSRSSEEEYRSFINNWCGLRYVPRTKTPKSLELHRRLVGGHRRGTVPPGAIFLTFGADVHDDNSHWIVRAWGEGCTSWLVDWGLCPVQTDQQGHPILGSQIDPLEGMVIHREWQLVAPNALGQTSLTALKGGIDCGWVPLAVHNFARRFPGDRVLTVAGDTQPISGQPWSFSVVERNQRTGKPYPGGLKRWAINTDQFKQDLHDRWLSPLDKPGAWFLTSAPFDEARSHLDHVVNEGRITAHNRGGYPVYRWIVLRKGIGNHFLDCEVYARAMADMVTGGVWENLAERFRAAVEAAKRQGAVGEGRGTGEGGGFIRRPGRGFGRKG